MKKALVALALTVSVLSGVSFAATVDYSEDFLGANNLEITLPTTTDNSLDVDVTGNDYNDINSFNDLASDNDIASYNDVNSYNDTNSHNDHNTAQAGLFNADDSSDIDVDNVATEGSTINEVDNWAQDGSAIYDNSVYGDVDASNLGYAYNSTFVDGDYLAGSGVIGDGVNGNLTDSIFGDGALFKNVEVGINGSADDATINSSSTSVLVGGSTNFNVLGNYTPTQE